MLRSRTNEVSAARTLLERSRSERRFYPLTADERAAIAIVQASKIAKRGTR